MVIRKSIYSDKIFSDEEIDERMKTRQEKVDVIFAEHGLTKRLLKIKGYKFLIDNPIHGKAWIDIDSEMGQTILREKNYE